ncbi:MAG: hypothetical protein HYV60_19500 [Planctomycetia bacterium]|nr:hypothetical protein [Planctomycetia bacterium]
MNTETIREWLNRHPFEPFLLSLSNGETYEVRHPENVAIGKNRLAVVDSDSDSIAHIALIHINSIKPLQLV